MFGGRANRLTFRRVKRLKLWLAWFIILVLGIGMTVADHMIGHVSPPAAAPWYSLIPYKDLAIACWTTLLVSFVYEWFVRAVAADELQDELFSTQVVKEVLSTATVNNLLRVGLQRVLGDEQFGNDLYHVVRSNFGTARRRDALTTIVLRTLQPDEASDAVRSEFYQAVITYEFRRQLSASRMRFLCVDSTRAYNLSYDQAEIEWRWQSPPSAAFPTFSRQFFSVDSVYVDDQQMQVDQTENEQGHLVYTAHIPVAFRKGAEHRVRYTTRVLVERFGHMIRADVREPTKGLRVRFDYADTDIGVANVVEMLSSSRRPTQDSKHKRIDVVLESEWVIPQSGVTFIWTLAAETSTTIRRQLAGVIAKPV